MSLDQITSPAQFQAEVIVNENFRALEHQGVYGQAYLTTTALTWGYHGGRWGGIAVAAGTLSLTNASTNYIVVAISTGVISTSTSVTNWNDAANYARVYKITTAGGVITATEDHRAGPRGVQGGAAAAGTGTVTSVDASGGVQTTSGSAITSTGTIQGAHVINAQTGTTYAVVAGDRGKHVTLSNAASIAASIAQAGTTGFENGYYVYLENIGVGAVTLTPTTSTVNGSATIVITTGVTVLLFSDGTNYRAAVIDSQGLAVNAQTGTTYTYLSNDRHKLVTHTNASAIAATLPQATGAFGATWAMFVQNRGAGTLTITPTTSTIDGAASLALTTNQGTLIASDGTNYFTMRGIGGSGSGLTNFTESVNSSAPNATIPAVRLLATNAATNVDAVFSPKGTGSFLAQSPDNTTTGGNKRATNAVDLQQIRSAADMVAGGSTVSAILGGQNNKISGGNGGFIGGGSTNTISSSGNYNSILGGDSITIGGSGGRNSAFGGSHTVSGAVSYGVLGGSTQTHNGGNYVVGFGSNNTVSADYACAIGFQLTADAAGAHVRGQRALARGIIGVDVFASASRTANGDSQKMEAVYRGQTTDAATAVALTTDSNAAAANNQLLLPTGSGLKVRGQVVGRSTSGDVVCFDFTGLLKNVSGTVSLVGSATVTQVAADAAVNTCTCAVIADNTNKTVKITVNGVAATTIYWVAEICAVQTA